MTIEERHVELAIRIVNEVVDASVSMQTQPLTSREVRDLITTTIDLLIQSEEPAPIKAIQIKPTHTCDNCAKDIGDSLWGWCSIECLDEMNREYREQEEIPLDPPRNAALCWEGLKGCCRHNPGFADNLHSQFKELIRSTNATTEFADRITTAIMREFFNVGKEA